MGMEISMVSLVSESQTPSSPMLVYEWRAYFQKGLDPLSVKIELLISRHYSAYVLPLESI